MSTTFSGFSDLDLTRSARQALELAASYAAGTEAISPEHLLRALLDSSELSRHALRASGADVDRIRAALGTPAPPTNASTPPLGDAARQVLADARREALHLGHYQLDALHLLLGMLYDSSSQTARILDQAGASLVDLRQQLLDQPRRWRTKGFAFYLDQLRPHVRPSPVFLLPLGLMFGAAIGLSFGPPETYVRPLTMLFVIGGWIVSLCLHEFGHAVAAYLGGDESVRDAGYLTLNPLRYANPIFSIVLPVLFLLAGGIGLPGGAVYVNLAALRSPRWERIVAAAGPLATLLFGILTIAPFWLPWQEWWLTEANVYFWPALAMLGFLQVSALLFNLLPIPPLDGFGILAPSLPLDLRLRLRALSGLTMMILFSLMWHDNPLSAMYWTGVFQSADQLGVPFQLLLEGFQQFGVR